MRVFHGHRRRKSIDVAEKDDGRKELMLQRNKEAVLDCCCLIAFLQLNPMVG